MKRSSKPINNRYAKKPSPKDLRDNDVQRQEREVKQVDIEDVDDDDDDEDDDSNEDFDYALANIDLPAKPYRRLTTDVVSPIRSVGNLHSVTPERATTNGSNVSFGVIDDSKWSIIFYSTYDRHVRQLNDENLSKAISTRENWGREVSRIVPNVLETMQLTVSVQAVENFNHQGVMDNVVSRSLSGVTRRCFGEALRHLGIPRIDSAADMTMLNDGVKKQLDHSLTFLVTVVPMVNGVPSAQNRMGVDNTDVRYWSGQVIHRRQDGEPFNLIELAAQIPLPFISDSEKNAHLAAVANHDGPFTGDFGHFLFVGYQKYSYIIQKILSLPVVRLAESGGWMPVLAIKDVICQVAPKFGINGYRIATTDATTRSFICLVGFIRYRSQDHRLYDVIGILNNGSPVTLQSHGSVTTSE